MLARLRLAQVTADVFKWTSEIMNYVSQVRDVEEVIEIPEADKKKLRESAEKIVELFTKAAELSEEEIANKLIGQLIASHVRMRNELAKANALLTSIRANRSGEATPRHTVQVALRPSIKISSPTPTENFLKTNESVSPSIDT